MTVDDGLNKKFGLIKKIYESTESPKEKVRVSYGNTEKGHYFPSDIKYITNGIKYLIKYNIIDRTKPFFDAGAGDGRVLAVTSIIYNIPSFGLEYDEDIVEEGIWKIEKLKELKMINYDNPFFYKQGDFNIDKDYRKMGINFKDIGTFFNFDNGYNQITKKISEQSLSDTCFILMRITTRIEKFNGLRFLSQINIANNEKSDYNFCIYKKE